MEQEAQNQEIDLRLPFRTGWPILPVLPVKTWPQEHNYSKLLPDWNLILPALDRVMLENNVLVVDRFLCYRYHKRTDLRPTLLYYSDLQEEDQKIENWRQAVRRARDLLQLRNIENIAVEIVDQRVAEEIKTEIILSTEKEVLDAWTKFTPRIHECLSNHDWLSLDLLHRSWIGAQENVKATVVISAADANESLWWDQTIPALRAILPDFLGIELVYLDTIRAFDALDEFDGQEGGKILLARQAYENQDKIQIGASCGRHWDGEGPLGTGPGHLEKASGTLGGLIMFEDSTRQYGLSNHHVFFEGKDIEDSGSE
jgi:hypothetical protein